MPNPVFEPTIIPRHLDLFCRKDDGVHSTVTKLDGGSAATKKTADMAHASKYNGTNKKTTDERKSSSGSDSFMGDARRLSEAGVRRSSGNSVVLTEDTDKFIIGNRIWVGGTKPGHIAYIGETNFGTGDWAGIVLDEPIGKNDGSVGGTRYFQCGPKKGIFARLTNLTSTPLGSAEDSMIQSSFATSKPLGFSTPMPKRQASTVSNVSSIKTVPKSVVQQSMSKSSSDLKIGDRVIISSGQGSKLGILRYRGMTQFAPGEWCGIELDEPLGKNNGTVEGIKYFECEDKFGLFTPLAKVSKSPMSANRMATNCAVHKNKRSPGSMNGSMVSGVTTNTMSSVPTRRFERLSELDRLKLQLTQMKNENELLRSQVIKAANQADVAEKRLEETLKAHVDKPSETQVSNIMVLQNQLDSMKKQMEEDKEKVQNLQFTSEEQNVVNSELQSKNAELLTRIKELDFELDKERNLVKDVEIEKMKIFEKEEELCRVKEELETLKKLIDNNEDELQKSVSSLSSEVVDKEAVLNTLRQTLNENSQTHDRLLKESNEKLATTTERLNKVIEEKNKKLEQNQEMIDQLNEGIKCLSALKNDEHDDIVNNLKNELTKLKDENKIMIDKKEEENKICLENHIKIENELKQELKSLLENKNLEIEELRKNCSDLKSLSSVEKGVMEKLKLELKITTDNLQNYKTKNVYGKQALQKILDQQIQSTLGEIENLNKKFDESVAIKENKINTCNSTLMQVKEYLIKSKSCLEVTFNEKLKEKDNEIKILSNKLNELNDNVEKLKKVNVNVTNELEAALKITLDKTALITDLEKKYNDLECQQDLNRNELEKELATKINSMNNEIESLKLEKSMLEEEKNHYVKEMTSKTTEMDIKLKQNDVLIEELNRSLEELTLSKQHELDSMIKCMSELEKEREQIFNQQKVELAAKDTQINTLSEKLEQTLMEKHKQDLYNTNLQAELTNETTKYQTTTKDLQDRINELEEKLIKSHETFKTELEQTKNEKDTTKSENLILLDKLKSLENLKLNLEEKLVSNEVSKQEIENLNKAIREKTVIIDDNQTKIKHLDDLVLKTKNKYEVVLKEKEEEIKELLKIGQEKMNMEKLSLEEKTKVMLDEKDKENSVLHKKIKDFENMKISFEKRLEESESLEKDLKKLNEVVQEKIKTIEDNNLKIEQLNSLVSMTKNELEAKLMKKDEEIKELLKVSNEKIQVEKEQIEKLAKITVNEKNIENSKLLEKINTLEKAKVDFEKQLEVNKTQENTIIELNKTIEEKTKIIDDINLNIKQLNDIIMLSKDEFNAKLKEKEDGIKELLKMEKDKLANEKLKFEKNNQIKLDEKDKEILSIVSKLNTLEDAKTNFEKQLEIYKTQEHDLAEMKRLVEEKTKIFDENNSNVEFQHLEISRTKDHEINELKKVVKEKTETIDNYNSKIELLNNLMKQTQEDFNIQLKEKDKEIENLVKMEEEKLTTEKIAFETRIKICLNEKDAEINVLKTQLQEFVENNSEKELMLKLESITNDLEKEKNRASNLEKIKRELDKTVLEHKTELEQLEESKKNMIADMTKTIEEQQILNVKLSEELNRLKPLIEKDRSSQSHLEFRIQELTDENHCLNERIEGNNIALQKNNNFAQEKYNIERKYEEAYSMLKIKENQILVLQTELNSWKLKDMGNSKNNSSQEKTDKTEAHLLAEKNEEIKMLNSIILGLHKKLSAVMETDVSDLEIEKNPSGVSKEEYQKLYKTAKNNIKLKECESLSLKQEIYKLKTENERYSEFKAKCERLENDKKALQKLIVNYESSNTENVQKGKGDSKSESEKILEEKDWQINLLNNIIADLHSKVSDNKFKIDSLEKQILESGMDQNKKIRLRTTRLYCERCEIFDSHDTEDCPEKPESPKFQRKRRVFNDNTEPVSEPFCVCCDMFGHTADECDSFQTF